MPALCNPLVEITPPVIIRSDLSGTILASVISVTQLTVEVAPHAHKVPSFFIARMLNRPTVIHFQKWSRLIALGHGNCE